jgi:nicotinate phosphoribosyltransferase
LLRLDGARDGARLPRLAAAVNDRVRASDGVWDPSDIAIELSGGEPWALARAVVKAFAAEGLPEPAMLVSGDVDERAVLELRAAESPVRGFVLPAEGPACAARPAHYDLVAIENDGSWSPRLRAGRDVPSSSDPGRKLLVRYADAEGHPVADIAHSTSERILRAQGGRFVDRATGIGARLSATSGTPLRATVMRAGRRAIASEPPSAHRERARRAVHALDESHRRIVSPARYRVGLSPQLASLKAELFAGDP